MLSVILTILKAIGIILLVILGILLLLLTIVMFVPVRYRSSGMIEKAEEGIVDRVAVKVTWLLRIVSVSFNLNGKETDLVIRIFGKKLSMGGNDKTNEKKKKKKTQMEAKRQEVKPTEATDKTQKVFKEDDVDKEVLFDKTDMVVDDKADEKKVKKSIKEKLAELLDKIKRICQKIKNINEIKNRFIEYLKSDKSKEAIRNIKLIVFKVLKHILPHKLRAKVTFGFEDPSTTGKILGVASIFYGIYGNNLELEPDFEHEVLKAEYKLKGRIRLFTLLIAALKIYRNKWIREFIAFSKETVRKV